MGLVAHYKLDGNANDALGRYNGVASNVTWVDGKLGQAGSFNGSSSSVNFNMNLQMSWSASFWVKGNGIYPFAFLGQGVHSARQGLHIQHSTSTNIRFGMFSNDTDFVVPALSSTQWTHYVFIYNHGEPYGKRLFRNGVEVTGTPVQTQTSYLGIGTVRIGATYSPGTSGAWANGLIDDVRIYDHALSEREVRDLAQGLALHYTFDQDSGAVTRDSSTQGNDGVVTGATWVEGGMVGKGCYDFTAASNKVVFNDNKANYQDGFTISAWVFKRSNGGGTYGRVFDKSTNTSAAGGYYLYVNAGAAYAFRVGGTTPVISTPALNLNQWYLLTATVDAGNVARLYVDGVQVSSGNNHNLSLITTNNPLTIGNRSNATDRNFDGQIDDVRIYATALSADEVREVYQQRASLDSQGNLLC